MKWTYFFQKIRKNQLLIPILVSGLLLTFQNCGQGFSTKSDGSFSESLPSSVRIALTPASSPYNPLPILPAVVASVPSSPQNSLDTVDPNVIFPNINMFIPNGETAPDTVPNTLDLAEMSAKYLDGITKTLLPENPYFLVPPGMVDLRHTPTLIFKGGAPNWGKSIQAMAMARRISGYDLNNANGTLNIQMRSTKNMIDPNINRNLIDRGEGAWIAVSGANPENQMTTAVDGLMELYKQAPTKDLRRLIQNMVDYHSQKAVHDSDYGVQMAHYRLPEVGSNPFLNPPSTGALGYQDWPFHVGKTIRALSTWFNLTGDTQAYSTNVLLSNFILAYGNGLFWRIPSGFSQGTGEGHFAGHMHSFANGLMGLLWEAETHLRGNPNDPRGQQLLQFVRNSYNFVRNSYSGYAVALGNFGEICMTGDMLRLAVKLTELGAGDFNEDIERWTRNQIAESQIRGAITIESHPGDPLTDMVGEKVHGLFFEDATHPFAIPDGDNDQGGLTLQLVACGLGNVIHGISDVWDHIVQFIGNVAQVNLLLNRATWYLDIKSEIPYRGAVHVVTRASLGPVTSFEMRIPDGVDPNTVQVKLNQTTNIGFQWVHGNYVKVSGLLPNTTYTVQFPIVIKQMTIRSLRNQSQNWVESNYPLPSGWSADYMFHENDAANIYTGTFRGNTLVAVDHRPSSGIALYQGEDRTGPAALGNGEAAAPTHGVNRFRLRPK